MTEAQGHHCEGAERSAEQTQPWGSLVEKAVVMFRRLEFGFPWRRLSDAWINCQPNGNGMLGPSDSEEAARGSNSRSLLNCPSRNATTNSWPFRVRSIAALRLG